MTRIFSNHIETGFNQKISEPKQKIVASFKNSLITVARNIEALFLQHANVVKKTVLTLDGLMQRSTGCARAVNRIINAISSCKQKRRPNRSYDRRSGKPINKWYPEKGANTKAKTDVTVVIA